MARPSRTSRRWAVTDAAGDHVTGGTGGVDGARRRYPGLLGRRFLLVPRATTVGGSAGHHGPLPGDEGGPVLGELGPTHRAEIHDEAGRGTPAGGRPGAGAGVPGRPPARGQGGHQAGEVEEMDVGVPGGCGDVAQPLEAGAEVGRASGGSTPWPSCSTERVRRTATRKSWRNSESMSASVPAKLAVMVAVSSANTASHTVRASAAGSRARPQLGRQERRGPRHPPSPLGHALGDRFQGQLGGEQPLEGGRRPLVAPYRVELHDHRQRGAVGQRRGVDHHPGRRLLLRVEVGHGGEP